MKQENQQDAFAIDLGKLVDRYAAEFQLTYASIIGALELQKIRIATHALKEEEE